MTSPAEDTIRRWMRERDEVLKQRQVLTDGKLSHYRDTLQTGDRFGSSLSESWNARETRSRDLAVEVGILGSVLMAVIRAEQKAAADAVE